MNDENNEKNHDDDNEHKRALRNYMNDKNNYTNHDDNKHKNGQK